MSSYTLFEMPQRVARKQHRCIWCGQRVEIGAKYLDERSVYDGNIQRHRWHPECHAYAQAEHFEQGEDEFTAGDNERPSAEWMVEHVADLERRYGKTLD